MTEHIKENINVTNIFLEDSKIIAEEKERIIVIKRENKTENSKEH